MNPMYISLKELRTLPVYQKNWPKVKALYGVSASMFLNTLQYAINKVGPKEEIRKNINCCRIGRTQNLGVALDFLTIGMYGLDIEYNEQGDTISMEDFFRSIQGNRLPAKAKKKPVKVDPKHQELTVMI